jgi:hypothetical protein
MKGRSPSKVTTLYGGADARTDEGQHPPTAADIRMNTGWTAVDPNATFTTSSPDCRVDWEADVRTHANHQAHAGATELERIKIPTVVGGELIRVELEGRSERPRKPDRPRRAML